MANIDGSFTLQYRSRYTDEERDQDMYGLLSLNYGDKQKDKVTAHAFGRVSWDMDGDRDRNGAYVFDNITDTFDQRVNARLYAAYLDVHRTGIFELARIGRQTLHDTPEIITFDGLFLQSEPLGRWQVKASLYGGVPTHLFESSTNGDQVVGSAVDFRPWQRGRFRVDWTHVKDETDTADFENDLIGASWWQQLTPNWRLYWRHTWLETETRDTKVRASGHIPEWDLDLQVSYFELFESLENYAIEFDPFFRSAFQFFPYYQWCWSLSKGLGERASIAASADLRRLRESDEVGQFNREFERYSLTPTIFDVFIEDLSVSLTGDYWNSDGEDTLTYGGDLTHQFHDDLRASVGTNYSLYKYDLFTDRIRDRVRVYYAQVRWTLRPGLRLRVDYTLEDDDFETYYGFNVGVTWTF